MCAVGLIACGGGTSVARYCEYGAVSQAQLDGCESHVTADEIDARDTNAARYAKGKLNSCEADSGPFCGQ
jgi:hypothetical protein